MVVSRFDARDFMLSSEFMPRLAPDVTFAGDGRSLAEYVVTGTEVVNGKLYAMSAAFSTLLVVDLDSKTVTGAYGVTGVLDPVGLASRGDELLLAQADGRIAVVKMPGSRRGDSAFPLRSPAHHLHQLPHRPVLLQGVSQGRVQLQQVSVPPTLPHPLEDFPECLTLLFV